MEETIPVVPATLEQTLEMNTAKLQQVVQFATNQFAAMTQVILAQDKELTLFREFETAMRADGVTEEGIGKLLNGLSSVRDAMMRAVAG